MGSSYVDGSPGWGSIFGSMVSGLESAPGKALSNIAQAEAIKDARIKRQREQELYDLGLDARSKLDPAILPAQAAPVTAYAPFVGDINNPADMAGVPTTSFIDPRDQANAEAKRALAVSAGKASIAKDPTNWASQLAQGDVAAAGMPQTAQGRAEAEFRATGRWPSHIGRDESKNPLKQWVPINEKNEPIGQAVASAIDPSRPEQRYALASTISLNPRDDSKVTMKNWVEYDPVTNRPTGRQISAADKPATGNWLLGGVADATVVSPLKDQAAARAALAKIEDERIANGGLRTPVQAMEAARLFEVAYPKSRVEVDEAGRKVTKGIRAEPIPPWLKQLHRISDDVAKGRHITPLPAGTPDDYVDPNADEILYKGPANAAELRKEYQATQAVSDWVVTAPLYNSAIKSANAPTNQGDINIMYAFAKLMDPGSVVRDQEGKLVMNSGTIPESIVGTFNRLVRGGGTMDPQVRLNLIETLKNRMDEIRVSKDITDTFYRDKVAPAAGLKPEEVLVPLVEPLTFDRNVILQLGTAAANAVPTGARGSSVAAPPPVRTPDDILRGR